MLENIKKYLPMELATELEGMEGLPEELRIRYGGVCSVYGGGEERRLRYSPKKEDVEAMINGLAERSLYAFMDELRRGYFSIEGGIRIGVAGRMICEYGKITHIRDFTSINMRFPRQLKGISAAVMPFITKRRSILSTLIVSPPQMGKTTLLRDIIRRISDEGTKCAVVDERCEIWAEGEFDIGRRTDVLSACPKAVGMGMALRSLSPQVIATDEIGGDGELLAISDAANAGAKVIATAHGGDIDELMRRMFFRKLMEMGTIERIILLSDTLGRGTVERIYDNELNTVCNAPFLLKEVLTCEAYSDMCYDACGCVDG